jgi:uncharacterized protein involved in outer membrane biogenesis
VGKTLKIVIGAGAVLIVVVAAVALYLLSNLDEYVRRAVERVGSDVTGTEVTLASAEISLKSTEGVLEGLAIANPSGFESATAFELDRIGLALELASLGSEEIVLREVTIDGARLTFEQRGEANNLQTLLDHVDSAPEEPAAGDETADVRLVIESFRFTNARVTVLHDRLEEDLELTIPDIVLRDIGRVGAGATVSSAAKQILDPILDRTVAAARERAGEELERRAREELDRRKDEAIDSLKKKVLGGE